MSSTTVYRAGSLRQRWIEACGVVAAAAALWAADAARAQEPEAEPATPFTAAELDELVGPIALYPDDLIAIVLPASTYPLQVVEAARFLDRYENDSSLEPDPDWDDSVVGLLNYPEVLRMMNDDLDWTWDLGAAVLDQRPEVLDAIQSFRNQAYAAGNLESDDKQTVTVENGVIEISPADPEVVYIPYYEPERVIVHQPRRVYHYYVDPYPLYYYPYPVGYSFYSPFFGVTSAFAIGWHSHFVHVYHHSHLGHPYFRHHYHTPYYLRRDARVNVSINHYTNVWRPSGRSGPSPRYERYRRSVSHDGYRNREIGERRAVTNEGTSGLYRDRRVGNTAVSGTREPREAPTKRYRTAPADGARADAPAIRRGAPTGRTRADATTPPRTAPADRLRSDSTRERIVTTPSRQPREASRTRAPSSGSTAGSGAPRSVPGTAVQRAPRSIGGVAPSRSITPQSSSRSSTRGSAAAPRSSYRSSPRSSQVTPSTAPQTSRSTGPRSNASSTATGRSTGGGVARSSGGSTRGHGGGAARGEGSRRLR
jgi:hypothetical protein